MEEKQKKRRKNPAAMAALYGLCGGIWLYLGLFRWEEDRILAVLAGVIWLVSAAAWAFRLRRGGKEEEP